MKEQIRDYFLQSLTDERLTRSEGQALRQHVEEAGLSDHDRAWLRSELFDAARAHIAPDNQVAILHWLESANKLLVAPASSAADHRVYFSPGEDCLQAILSQLRTACRSLKICVFTITDNRIREALLHAHHFGISVKIITDNDKRFDLGSDVEDLAHAGLPVRIDRTPDHMHHKFALIDDTRLLTGSYNWTRAAAADNYENLLVTDAPDLVRPYLRHFEQLWKEMAPL